MLAKSFEDEEFRPECWEFPSALRNAVALLKTAPRHDKERALEFLMQLLIDEAIEAFRIALPMLLDLVPAGLEDAEWEASLFSFVCWTLIDLGAAGAHRIPDCDRPMKWLACNLLHAWGEMPAEFKMKTKCAYNAMKYAWKNAWREREDSESDHDGFDEEVAWFGAIDEWCIQ